MLGPEANPFDGEVKDIVELITCFDASTPTERMEFYTQVAQRLGNLFVKIGSRNLPPLQLECGLEPVAVHTWSYAASTMQLYTGFLKAGDRLPLTTFIHAAYEGTSGYLLGDIIDGRYVDVKDFPLVLQNLGGISTDTLREPDIS